MWPLFFVGAPSRIRTCGLPLRRRTLYPLSYGRVSLNDVVAQILPYHTNSSCDPSSGYLAKMLAGRCVY